MKLSRRKLAGMAGAAALAAPALAQTPPSPAAPISATPGDLDQAARENNKRISDALAKFEIPPATEPAFQFKA
ncbi:MAG: hypothetical protein ABJC09_00320 [Terriglobia bacterium]